MPGTLFLVATPIGNLEDVTARALRVLGSVALIAAEDTRRTAHLLTRYAIATPTTSFHEHNEARKAPALLTRLTAGDDIALVSDAGTPLLSDPGRHLVQMAIDAGIRIEPLPGPSAIVTALAVSGFATHPFTFLGFPPTGSKDREQWMRALSDAKHTVVFFESPHRIRRTLEDIRARIGNCQAVVCRELTKIHEELVRGPIDAILERASIETGELTVVLNCGHLTHNDVAISISDDQMAEQFGHLTQSAGFTRRAAVQRLARQYGRRPNDVYAAVERGKKLVK